MVGAACSFDSPTFAEACYVKIVRRLVAALLVLVCAVGVGVAARVFQDWDTTKYMDEQTPGEFARASSGD
ncbi:MAG: hypothetical protein U1U88_000554 [Lawsonella clevelandensis]